MKRMDSRPAVLVAAVAVAAVAIGGALAYQQGPRSSPEGAQPLAGGTTSSTPSATPSATPTPRPSVTPPTATPTPSRTPSATPTTTLTGPAKVDVAFAGLRTGRAPQYVHVVGREVRGGAGGPQKVPGSGQIITVGRVGGTQLVIESTDGKLRLIRYSSDGTVTEVPDAYTLVTTADANGAAYSTRRYEDNGRQLRGSTVYADDGVGARRELSLPDVWDVTVLAYANSKVYYSASASRDSQSATLYTWTPGRSSATKVSGVPNPTAVSVDGTLAGSIESSADFGTCSHLVEVATGRKLWRSCDHLITGFTPDKATVIAGPAYGDGYAPLSVWALDGRTGAVLREWTGLSFRSVRAEDDQHLLMEVDDGPETKAAIIRCGITTGKCEIATPRTSSTVRLGN